MQHRDSPGRRAASSASSVVMTVWPLGRLMPELLQQRVKALPVLGHVDGVGGGAQNGDVRAPPRSW